MSVEDFSVKVNPGPTNVTFEIENTSSMEAVFSSIENFVVEKKVGDNWEKVPFYPCKCSVPCGNPPVPKRIKPGEETTVSWDYISRKCKGPQSEENKVGSGSYRIALSYKMAENNITVATNTLHLNFEVSE